MKEPVEINTQKSLIVAAICKRWGLDWHPMGPQYGVSFAVVNDTEAVAWMEVAITDLTIAQVDAEGGLGIPVEVWNNAHTLTMFTGKPFYIALRTADGGFIADFRTVEKSQFRIVRAADNDNSLVMVPARVFVNFLAYYADIKP